jgi:hypothetical protein
MASLCNVTDGSGKVNRLNSEIPKHLHYARLSFDQKVLENELEMHEKRFNPCDWKNHFDKRRQLQDKLWSVMTASRNALGECFEEFKEKESGAK